jgi:hypothetical protein
MRSPAAPVPGFSLALRSPALVEEHIALLVVDPSCVKPTKGGSS